MNELDIERERREFEAWNEGRGIWWEWLGNRYRTHTMQERWEAWLAAKRAVQGSAEPVAYEYGNEIYWHDSNAINDHIRKNGNPMFFHVAPPAPVSAEPVHSYQIDRLYGGSCTWIENWGHVKTKEQVELACRSYKSEFRVIPLYARAPPSTDAKDSERLAEAIKRMDRARKILTNGNPTPNCNWGMLDTSDLVKP